MINFDDTWIRLAENLTARINGPINLRFLVQPLMASAFGLMSGFADAKAHRPAFFWALVTNQAERAQRLRDVWKDVGKVLTLAVVLDIGYQIYVARHVYPGEVLLVGLGLALMPYLVVRGLANRVVRLTRST